MNEKKWSERATATNLEEERGSDDFLKEDMQRAICVSIWPVPSPKRKYDPMRSEDGTREGDRAESSR